MRAVTLTWELTLAALLPLVGRTIWATTLVDEFPVSAFGGVLHRVGVEPAPASGVEQAEIDFGDLDGLVLLRHDEHGGTALDADGMLRIEMVGWVLELEPSLRAT
jgi:hypothetical protein